MGMAVRMEERKRNWRSEIIRMERNEFQMTLVHGIGDGVGS